MSTYEFFKSCLNTAKSTYNNILNTPKARGAHLQKEVCEILGQLETALKYGELTPVEVNELKNEFIKLDFANISSARAAAVKSAKMQQN